jgi:hypothetical protein
VQDLDHTSKEFASSLEAFEMDGSELERDGQMETSEEIAPESPFTESEEMDLATELLSVTNEAELDQFIGGLIKKAGRAVGRFVKSPVGRTLGGFLKSAAKKALPSAGRAIGTYLGGPAVGAQVSRAASALGNIFGLELEGLSPEDQEFEVARQFVRFAGAAANKAANTPPSVSPPVAAKAAVATAAKKHAPGLLKWSSAGLLSRYGGGSHAGRWIRRGHKIILYGV